MADHNNEPPIARQVTAPNTSWMWMLTLPSIAVAIAGLYLAKGVLIPLTLAALLSFMLSPLCDWLERWRLGRIPAVLMTALLGFTLLGMVAWIATVQMAGLAPKIPEYRQNIEAKLNSVNEYATVALSKLTKSARTTGEKLSVSDQALEPRGTIELPFSVQVVSSQTSPLQVFGGIFGTLLEVLGTTGIVIVVVVFFLIRREDLRDRFIHLVGAGQLTVTTQMLEDASARVSRYLLILLLLNVTFGISVGVGLYLIGVPNAALWGILAAALRFIPYIGPWIAAVMPVFLSMAISTGWGATITTAALFVVLELFNNNFLEPWLYGKNTGVSAVAVLVAAVFWTWLWGPVGLLLATPLTVCVLVVGKHVPQLSFLDILLGTEPVFEPKRRVYQRLLAGDLEEAAELFEGFVGRSPLVEVYDTVLVPALAMTEKHWQLGDLNDSKHEFIIQSLQEMVLDCGERQQEIQAKEDAATIPKSEGDSRHAEEEASAPRISILCLPARTKADEVTALMLAQVLKTKSRLVEAVSVTTLAGDMDTLFDQRSADVICVSATPPAAVMHARYLCKRIRGRHPKANLVVGLWDAQGDLDKVRARIGFDAIVVATLAEAREQVHLLSQSLPPSTEKDTPPESDTGDVAPTRPALEPERRGVTQPGELSPR